MIQSLDKSGLAENTVVIYTTDHGENLGEHGLWWKNCMYESAARVPLIVHWPRQWQGGQRRAGACSLVDVAHKRSSGLAAAVRPRIGTVTRSFRGCATQSFRWKDLALSEYYGHNICSGYTMLRTGKYKFVYHATPGCQARSRT